MKKSKIFEVYEEGRHLYTKNLTPGKQVYQEILKTDKGKEYRQWDPRRSKLAAVILKGAKNVGLRQGSYVLYLGASTGTTISHVSDMIGKGGLVFGVDVAPEVMRHLVILAKQRTNLIPVLIDARRTELLASRVCMVDVLYQDVAQRDQVKIFINNFNTFVKKGGYGLLALKSRSIDVVAKPQKIFKQVLRELEEKTTVIDYRYLDPLQKDHAFYICKR